MTLQGGAQTILNVAYQSGGAGTAGTVTLTAQVGSVSGPGTSNISSNHVYGVTVGPKSQGVGVALSSPNTYTFSVHNASDLQQTYALSVICTGATVDPAACGTPSGASILMGGNATVPVTVTYSTTASPGLATVSLSVSNETASDLAILSVQAPADGSIIVASNSTNNAVSVTAYNGEYTPVTWTPGCSNIVGPITRCVGSPASISIPGHESRSGTIYFDVGTGPATGSFLMNALDTNVPTAKVTITAPDFRVTVTPAQATVTLPHDALQSLSFAVKNIGANAATYNTTGSCGGALSCTSTPQQVSLAPGASTSVGMAFQTGAPGTTGTAMLTATSTSGSFTATGTSNVSAAHIYGATVMPGSGGAVAAAIGATRTATFTVHNASDLSLPYTLTLSCSAAPVTACGITSPASPVTITGYSDAIVTIQLTAGATSSSGQVTLTASSGSTSATGSLTVNVVDAKPLTIDISTTNSDSAIVRDRCLTLAAGSAAASSCGDLRIVHALPNVRTMNKVRAPVLIYTSQHAVPFPTVAANVTVPPTGALPDTLRATLTIGIPGQTQVTAQQAWRGSDWPTSGATRRIVLGVDASTLATSAYPYTLTTVAVFNAAQTTRTSTASGTVIIVNRAASSFGAGWWVAGVEQLFPLPSGDKLWVGGDGSARIYHQVGTNLWRAPNIDRPDSLTFTSSTGYTRHGEHGLIVSFNSLGYHTATVNRLQHTTSFGYSGSSLASITLPVPAGTTAPVYQFNYGGDGKLASITSPGSRRTTIAETGGVIHSITDPDATIVSFGYVPATSRVSSRIDRIGNSTSYSYDQAGKLSKVAITMGPVPTPALVTTLTSLESQGYMGAPAADTATAAVVINGPRTGMNVVHLWLDRLGEPARITDGRNHTTVLTRADPIFRGLVTHVVDAKQHVVDAQYDDHGNIRATIDVNAFGDGRADTTSYTWDRTWNFISSIKQPEGEVVTMSYSSTTGNRLYQQVGSSASRQTTFSYHGTTGLLTASRIVHTSGAIAVDSVVYDAFGNVAGTITPRGFSTLIANDALGRPYRITTPIDTSGTRHGSTTTDYDIMDRPWRTVTDADPDPAYEVQRQSVTVVTGYDREGRVSTVSRSQVPNESKLNTLVTRWMRDAAGRDTLDIASDAAVDRKQYDAAGNLTTWVTRRGLTSRMAYNANNELISRITDSVHYDSLPQTVADQNRLDAGAHSYPWFPTDPVSGAYTIAADTAVFDYDERDALTIANNRDAHIQRAYFPNGSLQSESQAIRTLVGSDFTTHQYLVSYTYDRNGRRLTVQHPAQLLYTVPPGQTTYTYEHDAGDLATVTDPRGARYGFSFTNRGELSGITRPGPSQETRGYDLDGNWISTSFVDQATAVQFKPVPRETNARYDARGKMVWSGDQYGFQDTLQATYGGLGYLLKSVYSQHNALESNFLFSSQELHTYDALGNIVRSNTVTNYGGSNGGGWTGASLGGWATGSHAMGYAPNTGRLVGDTSTSTMTFKYDAAGNQSFMSSAPGTGPAESRASFYDASEQLRAADYRWYSGGELTPWRRVFEEFRYDALGRRILVNDRRTCTYTSTGPEQVECRQSFVRRVVWDGNARLDEIQTTQTVPENDTAMVVLPTSQGPNGNNDAHPFYGMVAYAYAPGALGVDQPISIVRTLYFDQPVVARPPTRWNPFVISPLWDMRGRAGNAVTSDEINVGSIGASQPCIRGISGSRCAAVQWPEGWFAYDRARFVRLGWMGSIAEDNEDKTGTFDRRSRQYDPRTGRFTQEDPLGLAGGLNAYGFANGDPVTYSDPFGLCPTDMGGDGTTKTLRDCPQDSKGRRIYSSGGVGSPGLVDPFLFFGGIGANEGAALAGEVEAGAAGAYRLAASGGTHAGFLRNYLSKSAAELESGIASFEKNVADHLNWIQNPTSKVSDFFSRPTEYQSGLLNKWKNDAVRNASQANILRGLLRELQ